MSPPAGVIIESGADAPEDVQRVRNGNGKQKRKKKKVSPDEAFDLYYAMGAGRTLDRLAEEIGKSIATVKRWSSKDNWKARLEERDEAVREKAEVKIVEREAEKRADEWDRMRNVNNAILSKMEGLVDSIDINLDKELHDLKSVKTLTEVIEKLGKMQIVIEEAQKTEDDGGKDKTLIFKWVME